MERKKGRNTAVPQLSLPGMEPPPPAAAAPEPVGYAAATCSAACRRPTQHAVERLRQPDGSVVVRRICNTCATPSNKSPSRKVVAERMLNADSAVKRSRSRKTPKRWLRRSPIDSKRSRRQQSATRNPDAKRHIQTAVSVPTYAAESHHGERGVPRALNLEPFPSTRYDLLACNLVLASIAALLMAAVGSSVKVVQILEGITVAGFNIDLGLGAAVNPGVLTASAGRLLLHDSGSALRDPQPANRPHLRPHVSPSVVSWLATIAAFTCSSSLRWRWCRLHWRSKWAL